jgi:RNA polymerase sigma-70 factor (ECF subfamily)
MDRYQRADPDAPAALVSALSPMLLRYFRNQFGVYEQSDDLLQETWLRIHRVRHTFRSGEPLLPWIFAIARRVRVDGYRRRRRIVVHEVSNGVIPERTSSTHHNHHETAARGRFDTMIAALPDSQREVIIMLKAGEMTVEEVARATSSTVGAVKQKAHRAYERLRSLLGVDNQSLKRKSVGP